MKLIDEIHKSFEFSEFVVCFCQFYKNPVSQYESDLLSVVHSLTLSMNEKDLNMNKSGSCNASCIRFVLVKLLRLYGYDAAVCTTRWQGAGKVPGGIPSKPYSFYFQ